MNDGVSCRGEVDVWFCVADEFREQIVALETERDEQSFSPVELAEIRRLVRETIVMREALHAAREIIYHEFSGDPTEPWAFIDEALSSEAGKR